MNASGSQTRSPKRYMWAALVGGVTGCAATFIYLNVDPFERMYAHADGFPRWSPWQLPFTAPEGAVGALAGMLVVLLAGFVRRRTPTV